MFFEGCPEHIPSPVCTNGCSGSRAELHRRGGSGAAAARLRAGGASANLPSSRAPRHRNSLRDRSYLGSTTAAWRGLSALVAAPAPRHRALGPLRHTFGCKRPSSDPLQGPSLTRLRQHPQQHGWLLPLPRQHPLPFSSASTCSVAPGKGNKPCISIFQCSLGWLT